MVLSSTNRRLLSVRALPCGQSMCSPDILSCSPLIAAGEQCRHVVIICSKAVQVLGRGPWLAMPPRYMARSGQLWSIQMSRSIALLGGTVCETVAESLQSLMTCIAGRVMSQLCSSRYCWLMVSSLNVEITHICFFVISIRLARDHIDSRHGIR